MKISIAAFAALFLAVPAAVMAQDTIRAGVMSTATNAAAVDEEAYNLPPARPNMDSTFRGTERNLKKSDADSTGMSTKASKEDSSRRERRRLSKSSSSKSAKSDGKGSSGKGSTKSTKSDD